MLICVWFGRSPLLLQPCAKEVSSRGRVEGGSLDPLVRPSIYYLPPGRMPGAQGVPSGGCLPGKMFLHMVALYRCAFRVPSPPPPPLSIPFPTPPGIHALFWMTPYATSYPSKSHERARTSATSCPGKRRAPQAARGVWGRHRLPGGEGRTPQAARRKRRTPQAIRAPSDEADKVPPNMGFRPVQVSLIFVGNVMKLEEILEID